MSSEVYVLGGMWPGGKCPGSKCPGGICHWGKSPGVHVLGGSVLSPLSAWSNGDIRARPWRHSWLVCLSNCLHGDHKHSRKGPVSYLGRGLWRDMFLAPYSCSGSQCLKRCGCVRFLSHNTQKDLWFLFKKSKVYLRNYGLNKTW